MGQSASALFAGVGAGVPRCALLNWLETTRSNPKVKTMAANRVADCFMMSSKFLLDTYVRGSRCCQRSEKKGPDPFSQKNGVMIVSSKKRGLAPFFPKEN